MAWSRQRCPFESSNSGANQENNAMKTSRFLIVLLFTALNVLSAPSQQQEADALVKQRLFRQALNLLKGKLATTSDREILNIASRAFIGLKNYDSAYIFAQRSLEEKENAQSFFLFTISARESNHIPEALQVAHKLVKADPNNPKAMAEAGATAVAADSLYLATKWLIAARELNTEEPTVHQFLGDVYFKQTVYENAKMEYNDAVRLDPSNTYPHWKLAKIAVKLRQYNDALQEYKKILAIDSTEYDAYYEIGNLFFITKQHQQAAANYLRYIESVPSNTKARMLTGKALKELRLYAQLIDVLKPAESSLGTNADFLHLLADAYFRTNVYDASVAYYEKLIAINQMTSEDYKQLGIALGKLQRNDEAIAKLQKATELDSMNTDAYFELGMVYYRKGDYENALSAYRKKAELDTGSVSVLMNIGYAEFQLKRYDSASTTFERVTSLKQDNIQAYLWLGRSLAQIDSLEKEETAYVTVLDIAKTDTAKFKKERLEALYSLGYIKAKQNKYPTAIDFMKQSIQIDENDSKAWLLLAQIFAQAKRNKESADACKRALKIDPKNSTAQKLLKQLQEPAPQTNR